MSAQHISSLQRFCIQRFAPQTAALDAQLLIATFQRWVRDQALDNILIDVVDYSHLSDDAGVLLIGHHANYYLGLQHDAGISFSCQRKTEQEGDLAQRIINVYNDLSAACDLLGNIAVLEGELKFDVARFSFVANDRLYAPNDELTYEALLPIIEDAGRGVYVDAGLSITKEDNNSKDRLAVRVAIN